MNSLYSRQLLTGLAILLTACFCTNVIANDGGDDVVKNFVAHVDSLDSIDQAAKDEIKQMIEDLRADEYSRMEAVTAGLARIYPEYETAIMATQEDDLTEAISKLTPYVDSDDMFLAADSSFFLARTLMNEQRYEDAIPILERLTVELGDYSLHAGPAVYFSGVAQANMLENQRALQSFAEFLDGFPEAPERLRVAAWRQIQIIQAISEGGLEDILQRMDFSERRLEIQNTDELTQEEQDRVVSMLAQLIEEEEKKECSSCNSKKNCEGQQESQGEGEGENEGEGKSNSGGTSSNPNGVVRRTYENGPASPWSRLRERTRDAANNAIKQRLPARYRPVVEEYYETTSGNEEDDK
ncbi:MAG: tetratricopeptide repeat protein [Pirellulaceae bacterium]